LIESNENENKQKLVETKKAFDFIKMNENVDKLKKPAHGERLKRWSEDCQSRNC
jgi:hypothetical protein